MMNEFKEEARRLYDRFGNYAIDVIDELRCVDNGTGSFYFWEQVEIELRKLDEYAS